MGWIWGSPSSPPHTSKALATNPTTALIQQEHNSASTIQSESSSNTPRRKLTRDEIAESEFKSVLEELEADIRPSSTKYNYVPGPPPKPSSTCRPSGLTLEEELLPTEMSCRQAFDAAFYCQSLGGQFNNLYRYGGIRSCSAHWNDFWFCMRTKSYSPEQREVMTRNHYKRKTLKYKVGPSSEDVWESRDKKLEWGEAFSEPVMWPVGSDEEWNEWEQKRRETRAQSI